MEEEQAQEAGPLVDLQRFQGQVILVSVKDGRKFRGKLAQFDEHMNVILEAAEEIPKEGQPKQHKLIMLKGGNISEVSV
ncbi:MAG: LSM domain-containing protein [Candidatus Hadarchaeota archaeon]